MKYERRLRLLRHRLLASAGAFGYGVLLLVVLPAVGCLAGIAGLFGWPAMRLPNIWLYEPISKRLYRNLRRRKRK